jgi:hypothetical protein
VTALSAALRAAADGTGPGQAGTGLLISSGCFLHRDDFTGRFTQTSPATATGTPMAWISWDDAITALDRGQIPASSGENAILRIAASLAAGCPVSLRETATSLDRRNLQLVTDAIRHAAGHRH